MMAGSEMGDSSGAAVATQPQQEVIVRTVREVSGTSWPDADSHQLWRMGDDHEGQAQSPTALECL